MSRDVRLWASILAAPSAWFISLSANFALAPLACVSSGRVWLQVVSAVSLLIAAASGFVAYSAWREYGPAEGAPAERIRNMALAGLVLSAGFSLVILAQWIPNILLAGCE